MADKSSKNSAAQIKKIWPRALDAVMPSFSELQYFLIVSITFTLMLMHSDIIALVIEAVEEDFRTAVYIIGFIALTIAVYRRITLNEGFKTLICFFYYGFFAFFAFFAFERVRLGLAPDLFDYASYVVTLIVLTLSVVRFALTALAVRLDIQPMLSVIATNFRDTQYRPQGFLISILLGIAAVFVASVFYQDPMIAGIMAYSFANIVLSLHKALFRPIIEYPSR